MTERVEKAVNPYIDERGRIDNYELPESVNLIATITSKKGSMRANHFHPEQEQKCILISGSYISVYKVLPDGPIEHQLISAGDLSIMPPRVAHTMIFLEDSVFLNLVKGNRDSDKFEEHTKKYDLVNNEEIEKYTKLYSDK
jgi:quercetin dioxygenase-like cupin family protein